MSNSKQETSQEKAIPQEEIQKFEKELGELLTKYNYNLMPMVQVVRKSKVVVPESKIVKP